MAAVQVRGNELSLPIFYSCVLYFLVSSHSLRESLTSPTVWRDKLPLVKREIERLRATVSEYLAEEVVNSCNLQ